MGPRISRPELFHGRGRTPAARAGIRHEIVVAPHRGNLRDHPGPFDSGETRWLDWLEKIDEYAFSHFSDLEHGEWFGYCDRRGNLTSTAKGNPYKGCFHVPRMLFLSWQRLAQA